MEVRSDVVRIGEWRGRVTDRLVVEPVGFHCGNKNIRQVRVKDLVI